MNNLVRDFQKGWKQNAWQTTFLLVLFPSVLIAGALGEVFPVAANALLGLAVTGSFLWSMIKDDRLSAMGLGVGILLALLLLVVYLRLPRLKTRPVSFHFAGHGFTVDSSLDGKKIMWT